MPIAYAEGKLHEASIIDRLREMGYEIRDEAKQREMVVRVIPGVFIRGHIDGWANGAAFPDGAVVEAKSMSQDRFKAWVDKGWDGGFRSYAWQISTYMHGFGVGQALYAAKNRNSGAMDVRVIEGLPVPWEKIRRKIIEVEKWVVRGELPPCDSDIPDGEKFFCPFAYLHDEGLFAEEDEVEVLDDLTAAVVGGLAKEHLRLTEIVGAGKAAEEQRKEINRQLDMHVKAKRVMAGGVEVTRVDGSRMGLDQYAVAQDLHITVEELKARYETPTKYTYFKTKGRGDDAAKG